MLTVDLVVRYDRNLFWQKDTSVIDITQSFLVSSMSWRLALDLFCQNVTVKRVNGWLRVFTRPNLFCREELSVMDEINMVISDGK